MALAAADVHHGVGVVQVEQLGHVTRGLLAGGGHGPVEDVGGLGRRLVEVGEELLLVHLLEDVAAGAHRLVQPRPDVPGPGLGAPQGDVPQAVRVVLAQQPGHVGVLEGAVGVLGEDPWHDSARSSRRRVCGWVFTAVARSSTVMGLSSSASGTPRRTAARTAAAQAARIRAPQPHGRRGSRINGGHPLPRFCCCARGWGKGSVSTFRWVRRACRCCGRRCCWWRCRGWRGRRGCCRSPGCRGCRCARWACRRGS